MTMTPIQFSAENKQRAKDSLIALCFDNGIFPDDFRDVDAVSLLNLNLIESGLIDSMGFACLQDLIESHYEVVISQEEFVAELHTMKKLIDHLSLTSQPMAVPC